MGGDCWISNNPGWVTAFILVCLCIVLNVILANCISQPLNTHTPSTDIGQRTRTPTSTNTAIPSFTPTINIQSTVVPPSRPTKDKISEYTIQLQSGHFTPPDNIKSGLSWLHSVPESSLHVILQLYSPPDASTKAVLEDSGIQLLNYIPNNAWFALVPQTLGIDDTAFPLIRWLGPILPEDKLSPRLLGRVKGECAQIEGHKISIEIIFFDDVNIEEREQIIQKYGSIIVGSTPVSNKIKVEHPCDMLFELAMEDNIRWIDLIPPPPTTDQEGD